MADMVGCQRNYIKRVIALKVLIYKRKFPIGMICRAWTTVNGEKIFAKDYGKRAFCFFPTKKGEKKKPTKSFI